MLTKEYTLFSYVKTLLMLHKNFCVNFLIHVWSLRENFLKGIHLQIACKKYKVSKVFPELNHYTINKCEKV
jgi:hypothetical protein